jgi:hypothetical protein
MKRLTCGILSSLVILSAAGAAKAETPAFVVAQSESTIERMYQEQRVVTEGMLELMAQMKTMMAQMKALTAAPTGKPATTNDMYRLQQSTQQQQQAMMAEMKGMMAEMKKTFEYFEKIYREKYGS